MNIKLAITLFLINLWMVYAIPVTEETASSTVNETEGMNDYEIEHLQLLDEYLSECTVLLRKNGDFPLREEDGKQIYLFGNGVRRTVKGGTGSGEVNSRSFLTIEEAFEQAGYQILSKDYLDAYDKVYEKADKDFKSKLQWDAFFHPISSIMSNLGLVMPEPEYSIDYPKEGDVALYILSRISGEGSDREFVKGDILLTDTERQTILTLAASYKKFMLVLNTGGPVDLSGLEAVPNILILSQLGTHTGQTLVKLIQGERYPSGKLTTTWTKAEDYPTIGDFGEDSDTRYQEGIFVGYRYFDTVQQEVLFPFGFGLGYTDFQIVKGSSTTVQLKGETFTVQATVKNIGDFPGKEVLELYLTKPANHLPEPYQILVQFAKTSELKPGAQETLTLSFAFSQFASYDEELAAYVLDEGDYRLRLGTSSRDTELIAVVNLPERVVLKQVQNKLGTTGFEDFTAHRSPSTPAEEDLVQKGQIPSLTLNPKDLPELVQVSYSETLNSSAILEEVKKLSLEDKAKLVVGAFKDGGLDIASVIGSAAMTVAGAAGETAQVDGLTPVVMADGPAGLRIARDYYEDKDGLHSTEGSIPASMMENFPFYIRWILELLMPKVPSDATILHQYTTAIPIGTAVAQSWNRAFADVCGEVVGQEMERFHIHLWLAPALNIHRNIRCGRNYEYYSEDPFLSGAFAASITTAVQRHSHTYVTIKHFAANNQEYNRYVSNSVVSERALREIYLKGFEQCIREASPKAVMTSYNLINGVHTSESKALVQDVLRTEFGFEGVVVTDWIVDMSTMGSKGKYSGPTASKVIQATGDIYMPGSKSDYETIVKAVQKGQMTMEELELSASRIYTFAKSLEE